MRYLSWTNSSFSLDNLSVNKSLTIVARPLPIDGPVFSVVLNCSANDLKASLLPIDLSVVAGWLDRVKFSILSARLSPFLPSFGSTGRLSSSAIVASTCLKSG